mmetsp:Transcript_86725/g.231488  ORF Transcript_86725/g.231488 Transcript_86725/m.231488 type:complete len:85 (-) Transcript_86725:72-326(-)
MADLEARFKDAAEAAKSLPSASNDEKLQLYSLYKQATVGDNDTAQPGMLDFTGKAKWGAWNDRKGMSKDDAMTQYIELVEKLKK